MPDHHPHPDAEHIRPASLGDLDALVALEQLAFTSDQISRRQFRHHIGNRSALLLVCAGCDGLLGDSLLLLRRGSRVARLYSIVIAPSARGRGIGQLLLDANEQAGRKRGFRLLRLEVRVNNAAAIALYEGSGYVEFGHRASYYADGSDARRYQKSLD